MLVGTSSLLSAAFKVSDPLLPSAPLCNFELVMHDKLLAGEDCLCETSRLDGWLRVCGSGRFPSPAIAGRQGWRTAMQRCC
jgi:hypothetical protein